MAEIYKRNGSKYFWVRIKDPNGGRLLESSGTEDRLEAQEYADRRQHEIWAQRKLGHKPEYSWPQAVLKWCEEKGHKKTHADDIVKFRWLHQHLGDKKLIHISRDLIMKIGAVKAKEATPATANRYLALVRAVMRKAMLEWEWVDKAPKISLYQEVKRRERWLKPAEAERLLQELPIHQADLARFALATGLRQANILNLHWSQVDLERKVAWVHADQAKANKSIGIPLNQTAMAVLVRQLGKHPEYVFSYQGKPVKQVNTKAWRRALLRANIHDFRWHDLRHTWASWMVQQGVPLAELQELGGWESVEMVRRYAHMAPDHLAKSAATLDSRMEGMIDLQRESRCIAG